MAHSPADVLDALQAQIAATEQDYKAMLSEAADRLRASAGGGEVTTATLEHLDTGITAGIQALETRLDQLKELRGWMKADPTLTTFAMGAPVATSARASAQPAAESGAAPVATTRSPWPLAGGMLALGLLVGWLASIAAPASVMLHLGR
ncbi:MAG TPA: hypothetical protein VF807_06560 [Ktedonobacterales bacterium]